MSDPLYDEDLVNLGYLKRIVEEAEESFSSGVSKNYGSKPNPPYHKGDTWIDGSKVYTCINSREIGLYTDSDWVTESGAREEAGRKNKIYLKQPSNYNPGDMWILQSDNDHIAGKKGEILITVAGRRTYSPDDWINMIGYGSIRSINEVANSLNNAIKEIENIQSGTIVTFYKNTIPTDMQTGDLWYVTDTLQGYKTGKVYKYNGTSWILLEDVDIKAFENANEERLISDGKIQSFYSSTTPTENIGAGDLWIDLVNNNQLYRYNGTNWVAVYDTKLAATEQDMETITKRTATIETDLGDITQRVSNTENILDVEKTVRLSEVIQTVDSISQRIKGYEDLTREKTSTNSLHLDNSVGGEGYILIFQIKGEIPFLVPSNELTPSNTLVPLGDHFKLVIDKQARGNLSADAQIIDITLTQPLRKVSTVYDEVVIEGGKIYIIRRIGMNNDGTLYIIGEPTKEYLGYVKLKTFEDNTYIYLKEYTEANFYCKYIIQSGYSDTFATRLEMSSSIEQTAEGINQEVRKKVDENEIISKINQTAEEISIDANRININGTVSANGNFKIDTERKYGM